MTRFIQSRTRSECPRAIRTYPKLSEPSQRHPAGPGHWGWLTGPPGQIRRKPYPASPYAVDHQALPSGHFSTVRIRFFPLDALGSNLSVRCLEVGTFWSLSKIPIQSGELGAWNFYSQLPPRWRVNHCVLRPACAMVHHCGHKAKGCL